MTTFVRTATLALTGMLVGSLGCSFYARDPDAYRDVTRELVQTRDADIKECYDAELTTNETVSGTVVVNFTVEKKTGKIINPQVDAAKTTAPAELSQCIVNAIDGLQLDPADQRDGIATFSWEFKVGSPKAAG